jgi:hypothetical protein
MFSGHDGIEDVTAACEGELNPAKLGGKVLGQK